MPFVRNPFKKQDENARPIIIDGVEKNSNGVKSIDVKRETACRICAECTTSSNHRSLINENEQFNISRESFDSYRRSFVSLVHRIRHTFLTEQDISGRSPIIRPNEHTRGSLDSRSFAPRDERLSSTTCSISSTTTSTTRRDFEDVGLDDAKPQIKKKGIFARLTESTNEQSDARPASSHEKSSWHHFGGRKRGQSGQGAELASFPDMISPARENTPKPSDHAFKKPAAPRIAETAQAPIS
ncbi:hypothetical protein MRB53_040576 [Persea americana]|nr:hypothetical protein MRB53_040576 [Persea americana]